ncbi:uncharacterized protein LOC119075065 [Bradysia coprophila]|uniref:uncharacterized protein LOC119075065 n=1 Tax=Bradysia coprophila TaxID=38358 RepID=UPI00187D7042|nr:uncharacterized protein LOC119075065 [Bradysia coprophila]
MEWHAWAAIFLFSILIQIDDRREIAACGELQTTLYPQITNGHDTHRWPWHAAIYHQLIENEPEYKCGGTVVSVQFILTAAHCVMVETEQILVSLGRLRLDAGPSSAPLMKVFAILTHPDFNPDNFAHDIAIVTLASDAIFNSYVQPVCVWQPYEINLSKVIGQSGTVVGWGLTEKGVTSNVLQEAKFPVVPHFTCLESNRDLFGRYLTGANFCAGTRNGTSVCTGDSGGSMTFEEDGKYYIRGIVSVGASKINRTTNQVECDPMQYALFTDVAQYLPWIRETVRCETHRTCTWDYRNENNFPTCTISLRKEEEELKCKIIFDDTLYLTNVTTLLINVSGGLPDVSSAADKFINLDTLRLDSLAYIERARLSPFTKISVLFLTTLDLVKFDADFFFDLKNLQALSLRLYVLEVLHAEIFKELGNLKELRIQYTRVRNLPAEIFERLRNVKVLMLSQNYFEVLPANIFRNNEKVTGLDLNFNFLKEVHEDLFFGLTNLEQLHLSGNQIEYLPSGLFRNNAKLMGIDLTDNKIKKIKINLDTMPQLSLLGLENNGCISENYSFEIQSRNEANELIRKNCTD